ncbi:MAG TPA: tyrosine recombinase XerC [Tissierellaceae bacterium]|nr:tyrosine recombinase XerC [Tissierellaceae bacterium]
MSIPVIVEDYLNYMESVRGISSSTIREYYFDLRTFFKFIKRRYKLVDSNIPFEDINISDVEISLIRKINIRDLHAYIAHADRERNNGNATKSRKVASLRSFFRYLHNTINVLDENPTQGLESPKVKSRHPVYLTLRQSENLLNVILRNENEEYRKRDYAIVMLFLNCGLRLSELSSIDVDKINNEDSLTVIGKGNKERTIYLNSACVSALKDYQEVRPKKVNDPKALFISQQKNRMSNRAIQHMVDKYLDKAGLDTKVYSVHKLRHTAATLMYKHGNVDIRALQEILGHESVSTTQIYTHTDDDRLRNAIEQNPLANRKNN